jgi:hypothetical protein
MYKHAKARAKKVSHERADIIVEANLTAITASNAPRTGDDLTGRDLSWFAEKVKQGEKGIYGEVCTITPAIAKRLMEQNADNRPISLRHIRQIAHDIKVKQWQVNGETIKVSIDGWLNDGQNRLLAIIEADEPVQCFVVFGVTRESRMTVDMGRVRTVPHYLGMEGTTNANYAGLIASQWASFELGYYGKLTGSRSTGITKQDTLAFYHSHKQMIDHAVGSLKNRTKYVGAHGTGLITAYCILQSKDPLYTDDFYRGLIEGIDLDADSIILDLRMRLIAESDGLTPYNKIELILKYWMAWKDGKRSTRGKASKIPLRGEWPKNFDDYGREPPKQPEEKDE